MARNCFAVTIVLSIAVLSTGAIAQKNDVSASIGRVFISDQGVEETFLSDSNIHFGTHLSFSATYARRFVDLPIASLTVEVPFVYDPEVRTHFGVNAVPRSFSAIYVTPSVRLNLFPHNGFSPWVSGGGGFARFGESSELVFGGPNPGKQGTFVGALQLGGGADFRLVGPLKLRGEFRDFYTGEPSLNINPQDHIHNYFVGAGLVFSF